MIFYKIFVVLMRISNLSYLAWYTMVLMLAFIFNPFIVCVCVKTKQNKTLDDFFLGWSPFIISTIESESEVYGFIILGLELNIFFFLFFGKLFEQIRSKNSGLDYMIWPHNQMVRIPFSCTTLHNSERLLIRSSKAAVRAWVCFTTVSSLSPSSSMNWSNTSHE